MPKMAERWFYAFKFFKNNSKIRKYEVGTWNQADKEKFLVHVRNMDDGVRVSDVLVYDDFVRLDYICGVLWSVLVHQEVISDVIQK